MPETYTVTEHVWQVLRTLDRPLHLDSLAAYSGQRADDVADALNALLLDGRVTRNRGWWRAVPLADERKTP